MSCGRTQCSPRGHGRHGAAETPSVLVFHPLGRKELVDRLHGERVFAGDAYRAATGECVDAVLNRGTPLSHHLRARQLVLMHSEGVREVPRRERSGDVPHVRANGAHPGAVLCVPHQRDSPAVRERLEGVPARVLVDAHDHRPTVLQSGKAGVSRALCREGRGGGDRNQTGGDLRVHAIVDAPGPVFVAAGGQGRPCHDSVGTSSGTGCARR